MSEETLDFMEAFGRIVSECADAKDVYPDAATALAGITESINELYACFEDGVFGGECICRKCGLRHGGKISTDPGF